MAVDVSQQNVCDTVRHSQTQSDTVRHSQTQSDRQMSQNLGVASGHVWWNVFDDICVEPE